MPRHECDCGAVYESVDALHACANRNHGRPSKTTREMCDEIVAAYRTLEGEVERLRRVNEDAVGALRDVLEHDGANVNLRKYVRARLAGLS